MLYFPETGGFIFLVLDLLRGGAFGEAVAVGCDGISRFRNLDVAGVIVIYICVKQKIHIR